MSGNTPKSSSDTDISGSHATGRLPHDTLVSKGPEGQASLEGLPSAPGALLPNAGLLSPQQKKPGFSAPLLSFAPSDRTKGVRRIPVERMRVHGAVSGMMETVDSTEFDATLFEREPTATRTASCVAFSTMLSDAIVERIISQRTSSYRKVSGGGELSMGGKLGKPAKSVWVFSCSGERSPVPAAEIFDGVRSLSSGDGMPSVLFRLYDGQHDASAMLDAFQRDVGNFSLLTARRPVCLGDERFSRAILHPRVQVYLDVQVSGKPPRDVRGKMFHEIYLSPSIATIQAGGADKEYGREAESVRMARWVDETLRTGVYSSMTVHGDAMMGKTRRAQEMLRYVKSKYPDATIIFAPAMDTHKAHPYHYVKTFATHLVESFSTHLTISRTKIYQELSMFVQGNSGMSLDDFSSRLMSFFQLLSGSSVKLFLVTDDMQWIDTESNFFLKKIFSQHESFGNMAVLNLTRTGDEVMNPQLLTAMKSRTSDEISLKPLVFLDNNGEPTELLTKFVCDLLRAPSFDTPSAKDYLKRLGKIAQGNAGILTEVVRSQQQAGVMAMVGGQLRIDHHRFMMWDQAGEAENVVVAKVDRLLDNPHYRDVLLYLVAFRESGACDSDLFVKFLKNYVKRPELIEMFTQLVGQQVIAVQHMSEQSESVLSFSQDLVANRLKKEFTDPKSPYHASYGNAHRRIAGLMFDIDRRANNAKNPHMNAILERFSPRAIVTHAYLGGNMKLAEEFAIAALAEAYRVGDHSATLEIYKNIVMGNSDLVARIAGDDDLFLSVFHSMTILRKDWSDIAIGIGSDLKKKFLEEQQQSSQAGHYDTVLIGRIERLYDQMCTFYFLRGTDRKLRADSIIKLKQWGEAFGANLFDGASDDVRMRDGLFMNLKKAYYLMLSEYMEERYVQACDMYLTSFGCARDDLYKHFPEAKEDPRCQKLELEAVRIGANAWFQGCNRAPVEGLDGSVFAYDDEEALIVSARDPSSPIHEYLLVAVEMYRSYLEQVAQRPDQVMDRGQVYRAKQGLARALGMLGQYRASFETFLDARSDAHRFGDPERFASITDTASSMLCNMGKHFLLDPNNADFQTVMMEIALLLRRSEQGSSPDQQDVFASLQYILKKAYQYSQQAAGITAELKHGSNLDTALINMLLVVETMVSALVRYERSMDFETFALLRDTLDGVLVPDPDQPGKTGTSFFQRMVILDRDKRSTERWNLYVGPCLARLANVSTNATVADQPAVTELFQRLLVQLGDCIAGRANLLDSLHALIDERRSPKKARLPSYDLAIDDKIGDTLKAMTLFEKSGHSRYSLTEF